MSTYYLHEDYQQGTEPLSTRAETYLEITTFIMTYFRCGKSRHTHTLLIMQFSPRSLYFRPDNHPILIGKPVLTGPHISQDSSFTFNCTFQTNESHPDQRFEVIFFQTHANRHGQLSRTVVADPVRVVSLDGKLLKNHMNKKVSYPRNSLLAFV